LTEKHRGYADVPFSLAFTTLRVWLLYCRVRVPAGLLHDNIFVALARFARAAGTRTLVLPTNAMTFGHLLAGGMICEGTVATSYFQMHSV